MSSLPIEHGHVEDKIVAALERIAQALQTMLQHQATAHGLSPTQIQLLLRLAEAHTPEPRPGGLARDLDITTASLSDSVSTLARKGLIDRHPDPRDRRGTMLVATSAGRQLANRLTDWARPARDALTSLDTQDRSALLGQLYTIIASLQRAGVITVNRMCLTCRHFRPDSHPGQPARHHCALLDTPLAPDELRIDCPEHEQERAA